MKKVLMAAVLIGGLSVPTVATAEHEMTMTYENRGQCQSALVKMRNEARKMAKHNNMDWDQDDWAYYCHKHDDGTYTIMSHWG
jgi:hypothetical protein